MTDQIRVLITGGAGFIGSALVRYLIGSGDVRVLNLDKLTYAGNLSSLREVEEYPSFEHRTVEICDRAAVGR
jgi:dTDP-glucose 4,6-dehydratase